MKKVYGDRKGVEKEIVLQIVKRFRKKYTITAILNALGVARSTYYRCCTAGITLLTVHEKAIIKLCQSTKYRNSHRKIKAQLNQENKINLKSNTIQRIIQKHNLKRQNNIKHTKQ